MISDKRVDMPNPAWQHAAGMATDSPAQSSNGLRVLRVLRLITDRALACRVDELTADTDMALTCWMPENTESATYEAFFELDADARAAERGLRDLLTAHLPAGAWHLTRATLPARDWEHAWKAHFRTEALTDRVVVKPSWEPYAGPADIVVELDPGMSFGTGQHATTRACVALLDRLSRNRSRPGSLLDLGCGSGILAIIALKLGYGPVLAADHDPDAVRIAQENCLHNGCAAVRVQHADVRDPLDGAPFDIVVANILADVLTGAAPAITAKVASHAEARLILSGILASQFDNVAAVYEALGFELCDTISLREWKTGCLRRSPASTSEPSSTPGGSR